MRLPIFLYHDVRDDGFDISCINPEIRPYILKESDFIGQMEWLHKKGYRVIGVKELVQQVNEFNALTKERDNQKIVVLVFDDGWASSHDIAYPLLKKYGFKATFFVTIENIGRPGMMNWTQIKELSDSGMSIGSHNLTHRTPVELSDRKLEYELKESKRILEEKLNKKIDFFSSPTGFYDKRIKKLTKKVGYRIVCFSKVGFNKLNYENGNFLCLKKIGIKRSYTLETFKGIVEGEINILISLRLNQILRDFAKSFLGVKDYLRLKSFVLKRAV